MRGGKLLRGFCAGIVGGFVANSVAIYAHAKPTHAYFPDTVSYASDVPLPETSLGFELGDWHVSPAGLTAYMRQLAESSDRVSIKTIGYSHERNALTHVYISSPENIANLEGVLKKHQDAKSAKDDILVVNLAYSVHGNEASGSNASPLVGYYLAASQEPWVKEFLAKTVVIIEPMQNPDGLGRFAAYANAHQGATANFDPNNRDHNEGWPSGRTNHYWFDLNRDWIVTVHPESKARIKAYQEWKPHVLGDYHEMGGDTSSYFFQPGHPKRTHPLTPKENQRITFKLAEHHAKALDARAQPYFTQERFDDFYYGKASTYPDATDSVGVLFEQSSVRGHARNMGGTEIRFQDGIANHLATSLSLLQGADAERTAILNYRFDAVREGKRKAMRNPIKAYVFADDNDPARAQVLLDILSLHKVPVHSLRQNVVSGGRTFKSGHAWIVKPDGAQYGLVNSIFETRKTFEDDVFYDISTWNLPLALNLPYAPLKRLNVMSAKPIASDFKIPVQAQNWADSRPVAYAFEWGQYKAPHLLQALLANDIHPRVSTLPFSLDTHAFKSGAIVVQPRTASEHETAQEVFAQHASVNVHTLSTGLSPTGPDLGSRNMSVLQAVKPVLLVGHGVSPTEAGEIRYAVDKAFGIPLTILDIDNIGRTDLDGYTHVLMVDGNYNSRKDMPETLKTWVRKGGTLIAQKRAAKWAEKSIISAKEEKPDSKKIKKSSKLEPIKRSAYQDYEQDSGKRRISGAVLHTVADLTHPLLFGYEREDIPVFYNARSPLNEPKVSYDTPLVFAEKETLMTGYAHEKELGKVRGTPAIALHRVGQGKVVTMNHNANFRAFWLGTQRMYANALFFTQAVEGRSDGE